MNDFTKEELEQIYFHLENEPIELGKKIKSMIENYCDHEWENPCCGCPNSACICIKCDKRI